MVAELRGLAVFSFDRSRGAPRIYSRDRQLLFNEGRRAGCYSLSLENLQIDPVCCDKLRLRPLLRARKCRNFPSKELLREIDGDRQHERAGVVDERGKQRTEGISSAALLENFWEPTRTNPRSHHFCGQPMYGKKALQVCSDTSPDLLRSATYSRPRRRSGHVSANGADVRFAAAT